MLWTWIDAHAATGGLCLVLAALGGLFFYLRLPATARLRHAGLPMPRGAWRALAPAGVLALLALAVMVRDMLGLAQPAGCATCTDWPVLDEALHLWLAGHATDAWVRPVVAFTQLGNVAWMVSLSAAVLALLLWRRDWLHAAAWVVATAGVGLWIRAIKTSVGRPRPVGGWVPEGGFSFPRGPQRGHLRALSDAGLAASAVPAPGLALARGPGGPGCRPGRGRQPRGAARALCQ